HLEGANLIKANLKGADLEGANFKGANLEGANLEGTNFEAAFLGETYGLSPDQLSKVKTLYNAKLDEELFMQLKEKCPALFERPDYNE
ncbi:MAG TPA: pentapeptide repeat-containing protein, partial [Methanosarcina sp.]|nr:pentapeptide repeat-containing protein [Methanosarcina sp.]